jgi:hypothetical protein
MRLVVWMGWRTGRTGRVAARQMAPTVEAQVLELRRVHRSWGARRIRFELAGPGGAGAVGVGNLPALQRAGLIEPGAAADGMRSGGGGSAGR